MATESKKPNQPGKRLSFKAVAFILGGILVGLLGATVALSDAETVWNRVIGVTVIYFIAALALADNLYETGKKEHAWQQLAQRTGLTCQVSGFVLFGYSVQVVGVYRGRELNLTTFKQGKSQVPSTRIELQVKNEAKDTLRLRGPFARQAALQDKGISNLFQASDARQFGDDKRFFTRSHPLHLVTAMFRAGPVRHKLQTLSSLVNIELQDQTLSLDQLGILGDIDYLHNLFELLSDLADLIEQRNYGKLSKLSPAID